jgi:hypothetical protein
VPYADDLERSRVERYQAAAELQESPSASIGENCAASNGCRSRARIDVNGRAYYASYGRTQFTVTTFLGELGRMTQPSANAETLALRAALKLDTPITLDGRAATLGDALVLARQRVEAAYRSFAAIRIEFGRGLDAARATGIWNGLSEARRLAFSQSTGLGRDGFIDMLGYVATGIGGRTEEEGRHALAASAAATVRYLDKDTNRTVSFDQWLVDLYSSRAPYDHVSRAFLRYNLRREHGAAREGQKIGVACVFSREAVAPPDASCNIPNHGPVDGSLNCSGYGSVVSVTATFGQCAAGWVIDQISSAPLPSL